MQLRNVPPSVFLQPQSTSQTAPVNETPVNDTPVNELPVNDLPVNDLPVNELGFDDLAENVPALGDIALVVDPAAPHRRLGEGALGLARDAARGPAAAERHAARLLRARTSSTPTRTRETRSDNPIPPITLADLDLTHSPLGILPASAIVLANVKLSWLRPLDTWCRLFGTTYCTRVGTGASPTRRSCRPRSRARR